VSRSVSVSHALSSTRSVVIRNNLVIVAAMIGAAGGLAYALWDWRAVTNWSMVWNWSAIYGWCGLIAAFYGFWLLCLELAGVRFSDQSFSLPDRRWSWLPIHALWRRKISYDAVEEITVVPAWLGMETVVAQGIFGQIYLLFHSRDERLRFFDCIKRRAPGVRIYRAA